MSTNDKSNQAFYAAIYATYCSTFSSPFGTAIKATFNTSDAAALRLSDITADFSTVYETISSTRYLPFITAYYSAIDATFLSA